MPASTRLPFTRVAVLLRKRVRITHPPKLRLSAHAQKSAVIRSEDAERLMACYLDDRAARHQATRHARLSRVNGVHFNRPGIARRGNSTRAWSGKRRGIWS